MLEDIQECLKYNNLQAKYNRYNTRTCGLAYICLDKKENLEKVQIEYAVFGSFGVVNE